VIRLSVPGTLEYRDIALRVVSDASKLVHSGSGLTESRKEAEEFDAQVVSAFGEAFNNIAIHGYGGRDGKPGDVDIEIEVAGDRLSIRIKDTGKTFDPMSIPPPEELPERGMGIFIIRSFMDEVAYRAGKPNVLEIVKRWHGAAAASSGEQPPDPKRGPRSGWRMKKLPASGDHEAEEGLHSSGWGRERPHAPGHCRR
jgi:serine/threonine-protein kinase RsbW